MIPIGTGQVHKLPEENELYTKGFWSAIDTLVAQSEIVLDRPKGTKHPRFDFIYPLDYGYLKDTTSPDGGGIDVWRGSLSGTVCDAVICTVDLLKKDSEIKLLIDCTEEEKSVIMRFHNDSEYMKGAIIQRESKEAMKKLQETDEEQRARIYPVILSEYNPAWPEWYIKEKANLEQLIGTESIAQISHYGSTSVPGLMAKPTVDILLEINENADINKLIAALPSPEYICLKEEALTLPTPPPHLMFLKGYLPDGFAERVYHIHVRYPGDPDELYFRDYLIAHPETAAEYAKLKVKLHKDFEHNRDGYTEAKTAFIRAVTEKARKKKNHGGSDF